MKVKILNWSFGVHSLFESTPLPPPKKKTSSFGDLSKLLDVGFGVTFAIVSAQRCFKTLLKMFGKFPSNPVVRTLCSHCQGPRLNSLSGN